MRSVFIANRGEIAVRIGRACRDMGLRTVQAYSEPDRDSLAVRLADTAVCVGAGPSKQSYLNQAALLGAAKMSGADAIHPGYGFLSENAEFAERCEAAGLTYIGPQPQVIRLMGDKAAARKFAVEAGVPVSSGSQDPVNGLDEASALARRIGYPVLVKAAAGGGGRGMRIVSNEGELKNGPPPRRRQVSATARFIWRNTTRPFATSRCRCWAMEKAWCISASATAPSSVGTRNWSRKARRRH